MRDKIADVLRNSGSVGTYDTIADAIIAALPDCIPDLVWSSLNDAVSPIGLHYLAYSDGSWRMIAQTEKASGRSDQRDIQGAHSACNEHHRAAIMSTFSKD